MPEKIDTETMREHTHKLYQQRMWYVLHVAVFIGVLILTRGSLLTARLLVAAWAVFILMHTVFLTMYEMRDGKLRQDYELSQRADRLEKAKREAEDDAGKTDSEGDGYYTIGSDGELIPLDEADEVDDGAFHEERRR